MNWEIIIPLLTLIFTSGIVNVVLYRKVDKRTKTAEAFEKEVSALSATIEAMKRHQEHTDQRLERMQNELTKMDVFNTQLMKEKHILEVKHSRNKSAMNKAYECAFCDDKSLCPVIRQRATNDEIYLKELKDGDTERTT
jgi:predicted ribosome quality control (RQC) complex YloA/Tae2 family protein